MSVSNLKKQRLSGYMFAALAIVLAAGGILSVSSGHTGRGILSLVASVFLGYLSWRQLQPGQPEKTVTATERTGRAITLAASQAFWLLVSLMVLQSVFQFIPDDIITSVYVLTGLGTYGAYWAYFRWRKLPA